jgi:fimbrial isopeptide formation D2 family protein
MHWTPLSGAKFEDVFGPSGTPARNKSRGRRSATNRRFQSRPTMETLETRLTPAITASIVASSLSSVTPPNVTIGEIVRERVVVQEPLSGTYDGTAFNVLAFLPNGLEYLPGSADIALVSNNGIDSTLDPAGTGGLSVTGQNVNNVTPSFLLPATSISTDPATGALIFNTGITDAHDDGTVSDYVVIEFNALVTNVATNQGAPQTQLTTNFHVFIGGTTCNCLGTDTVDVVEPSITNLTKTATVSPDGNTATYTLTFSNTGGSTAYDVRVVDNLPAGLTFDPNSVQVVGGSGLVDKSTAAGLDLTFDSIAVGGSVTITYSAAIAAAAKTGAPITNTVDLDYTSLPGPNGTDPNATGSVTPGVSGSPTGERNGQDGVGGLNDYDDAASATITVQAQPQPNSLSGFVFGDTNEDGVFDAGDARLSGVPIALVNEATGLTVAITTTDVNGFYSFANIPDGEYAVLETKQPNGYNDGIDFPGSAGGVADPVPGDAIRHVVLAGGVNAINYDFGECPCPPAQLSGYVYEDFSTPGAATNNDGFFEQNVEHGIAGVTVTLENLDGSAVTDFNGNPVGPVVTDANGFYSFTNLHAHVSYMVVETQPAAFADGKDRAGTTGGDVGPNQGLGSDFITNIPLDAGANSQMNNFGELPLPTPQTTINGFVYLDVNQDCIKEAGEAGLAGVTVKLTDVNGNAVRDINGNLVGNVQTDANGFYQFLNLPVGDYRVTELPPQPIFQGQVTLQGCNMAGTVNGVTRGVAPMGSDVITGINLVGGDNSVNNNFGEDLPSNVGAIVLSGNVYFDANKNSVFDPGDHPIGGATVHLFRTDLAGGPTEVAQTTTNEKGQYLFEIDTAGTYMVTLDAINGLIKETAVPGTVNGVPVGTAPANDDLAGITLADGDSGVNYNFFLISNTPVPPPFSKQQLLANQPAGAGTTGVAAATAFATDPSFANIDKNSMLTNIVAVGAGAGGGPEVKVYNFTTGQELFSFYAYNKSFTGGVRVAVADINGDGTPDIITAPGAGGGPDIKVFDGKTGNLIREFWGLSPTFRGGAYVAAGDVNGDGIPDIIIGAGAGGGPEVKVFDGATGAVLADFYAYAPTFRGGVSVAAGDFNLDGLADIVTGAGPGGGPQVNIYNSAALGAIGAPPTAITMFYAFASSYRGGVNVAANAFGEGDVTGDGKPDLVVGTASGVGQVEVIDGSSFTVVSNFTAYDSALSTNGAHVSVFDINGDGKADVVAGSGGGEGAFVRVVNVSTDQDLDFWQAFNPAFLGGAWVASA